MRKDLKIGLAIGAVLLVVLIVYLAVPSQNDQLAQNPVGADVQTSDSGAPAPSTASHDDVTKPATGDTSTSEQPKVAPPAHADGGAATAGEPKTEQASAAGKGKVDPFSIWGDALEQGKLPVISETPPPLSAAGGPTNPDTGAATPAPIAPKATPEAPLVVAPTPAGTDSQPEIVKPTGESTAEKTIDKPEAKPAADTGDTAAASAGRPHKIRTGETYSSIAKVAYGDARYYLAIEKANPNVDPSKLKPGMTINLPDVETVKGPAHPAGDKQKAAEPSSSSSEKEIDAATEYRVQSGDSLHKIAMKRYGTSTMADKIYEANKGTIGDDSAKLKIGMVLKMPANPNANESQISATR
jgi:nucleoid-associated protein YgaU